MIWRVNLAGGVTTLVTAAAVNVTGAGGEALLFLYDIKGNMIAGFCNWVSFEAEPAINREAKP